MQSNVEMDSDQYKTEKKSITFSSFFCLPPTLVSKVMKLETCSVSYKTNHHHPLNLPFTKEPNYGYTKTSIDHITYPTQHTTMKKTIIACGFASK